MNDLDREALDRHITGNYGDDRRTGVAEELCPECHSDEVKFDDHEYECESCGFIFGEDQLVTACDRPGRHGCGVCDACDEWADAEFESQRLDYP